MAKNSITDYDNVANNNTDIQSVDIAENCAPSGINNAIRELMADLADVNDGTVALTSPSAASMTISGDLTVDTDTLYVDSTNNRVGIGTSSPNTPFHVQGAQGYASSASNLLTSTTKAAARIRGANDASTSLFFGTITNDAEQYIQSCNEAGDAADDLVLNPFGGNVGIGTTSPVRDLQIGDNTDSAAVLSLQTTTTGNGSIYFGDNAATSAEYAGMLRYSHTDNSMQLWTSSTERMRIANTGAVSMTNGLTISAGGLNVYGNTGFNSPVFLNNSGASGNYLQTVATNGQGSIYVYNNYGDTLSRYQIYFYRNGGFVGSIQSSTTSTGYYTTSDYRLKENVVTITDGINRLKQLRPSRFNFISTPDRVVDGFLAHEAGAVVPEAITGEKDGMRDEEYEVTPAVLDDDGNVITEAVMGTRSVPEYQQIDEAKLVPLLTAALQEAIAKIEALEARVAVLEGN
jgi:hypothetical protein